MAVKRRATSRKKTTPEESFEAKLERELWDKARKDPWTSLTAEQLAFAINADDDLVAWVLKHSCNFRELEVHDSKGKVIPDQVAYRPERTFSLPKKKETT